MILKIIQVIIGKDPQSLLYKFYTFPYIPTMLIKKLDEYKGYLSILLI